MQHLIQVLAFRQMRKRSKLDAEKVLSVHCENSFGKLMLSGNGKGMSAYTMVHVVKVWDNYFCWLET